MIADQIISNWNSAPKSHAVLISDMPSEYPAWTVKFGDEYGVAVPFDSDEEISERFASARMYSAKIFIESENQIHALLLTSNSQSMQVPFSILCAEFTSPGEAGMCRTALAAEPVIWWWQWKELIGNKNINPRMYDVLGELCVLRELALKGIQAFWNGPDGASYDIESEDGFFEIKSSIVRNRREITVSNPQQLIPPTGTLSLVFCQFEPAFSGVSINSVVLELEDLGYSKFALNEKLKKLGFEVGASSRNKIYLLHNMIRYDVGIDFPIITNDSFVGGSLPKGIEKITYTVSLDGMKGDFWIGQV